MLMRPLVVIIAGSAQVSMTLLMHPFAVIITDSVETMTLLIGPLAVISTDSVEPMTWFMNPLAVIRRYSVQSVTSLMDRLKDMIMDPGYTSVTALTRPFAVIITGSAKLSMTSMHCTL